MWNSTARASYRPVWTVVTILGSLLLLLLLTVILLGYVKGWEIIGVTEYQLPKPMVVNNRIETAYEIQRGKTLWDWMQLLLGPILVPIGLLLAGYILNQGAKERELALEIEKQREAALQNYFDSLGDLIVKEPAKQAARGEGTVVAPSSPSADSTTNGFGQVLHSLLRTFVQGRSRLLQRWTGGERGN